MTEGQIVLLGLDTVEIIVGDDGSLTTILGGEIICIEMCGIVDTEL